MEITRNHFVENYNKPGGFFKLIVRLECSPQLKRDYLIKVIAEASPDWAKEIRKRLLSTDKIFNWPMEKLSQIFNSLNPNDSAAIIFSQPKDLRVKLLSALKPSNKITVETLISLRADQLKAELEIAMLMFYTQVRLMIVEGELDISKEAPELIIPEGIESQLNLTPVSKRPTPAEHKKEELRRYLKEKAIEFSTDNPDLLKNNTSIRDRLKKMTDK